MDIAINLTSGIGAVNVIFSPLEQIMFWILAGLLILFLIFGIIYFRKKINMGVEE